MFDTVVANHPYPHAATREVLENFKRTGDRYKFNAPPVNGYARPQLTWSAAPDGANYLTVRVSVPKMLFANNVRLVTEEDLAVAFDAVSDYASDCSGVAFDMPTANVVRLDYCHAWRVGEENVYAYLKALRAGNYPRLKTRRVINEGTVDFSNNSEKVVVYSKHQETTNLARNGKATDADVRASVGLLRIEHRFLNAPACKRLVKHLGLSVRSAGSLLRAEVADTVMNETISKLGLGREIESDDSRLALLREYYGVGRTYQRLAGFLAIYDEHGEQGLYALGYSEETFRRTKLEVEAAGAWLTNPTRRALSPLRLVRGSSVTALRSAIG